MADHELCDPLEPYMEEVLYYRSYNNRKGMGSQAAINRVMEDIYEVSNGYTEPCRIIKWDLSGYFTNAICNNMEKCFIDIIENNRHDLSAKYGDQFPDYLRWLTQICVHCNPQAHCELRTPKVF